MLCSCAVLLFSEEAEHCTEVSWESVSVLYFCLEERDVRARKVYLMVYGLQL